MKPCERCGGMILASGEWTTLPICGCPIPLQGWECPRCHTIHSPFISECDCPPRVETVGTYNPFKQVQQ